MNWYGILKVVHVLAAIVWIGGGAAMSILIARMLRARDRATLAPLLPQVNRFMQSVGGPMSGLVLLSGIAMARVGRLGFKPLWISLGFGGIILLGAFGGLVMSKRMVALEQAVASGDDATLGAAGAKVRQGSVILLAIMASVVAIMILKPTL